VGFTTYEKWISETDTGRPRSPNLQKLDDVLTALNDKAFFGALTAEEFMRLQDALFTWKKTEVGVAGSWASSPHNKNRAIEKLQAWVDANDIAGLTRQYELECKLDQADQLAMKTLADAIRDNTRNMLQGRKLTVKNSAVATDVNGVRGLVSTFKSSSAQAVQGLRGSSQPGLQDKLKEFLAAVFGQVKADDVLGKSTVDDFLAAATPFVSSLKNGGSALVKWIQAALALRNLGSLKNANASFAPGDPAAAFEAIVKIQDRELNAYVNAAAIGTVTAAAQTAFVAVDFGAVSGPSLNAARALALLAQKMFMLARDENETAAATKLLMAGPYDLSLFKASPLLGCYLISNSDTSTVINMAVGDYGKTGWKLTVEEMVKKAQPVFDKSRAVILGSRYEIVGMRGMKGQKNDWNLKALKVVPSGKIKGVIHSVTSKIDTLTV
jgi:hypothetical protein